MTWQRNETVRAGNSTARVKNFYPDTGLLVLYDIRGTIAAGTTIVGDSSGTTKTFANFVISKEYDLGYEPIVQSLPIHYIFTDDGEAIVTDDYYATGQTDVEKYQLAIREWL